MSEKFDGGPAFPTDGASFAGLTLPTSKGGMTLRDYFAAQVMSGIAREPGEGCDGYIEQRVRVAYAIADAMLNERAK